MRPVAALGRFMFASLFIMSGLMKLQQFNYNDGGALMPKVSPKLDSALSHLFSSLPSSAVSAEDMQPHYPKLLLAAIVLEVLGGLLFAFGSTLGAYMLMLFMVPTTLIMHDFWNEPDEDKRKIELVQVAKNLVIFGALVVYVDLRAQIAHLHRSVTRPAAGVAVSA